MVWRIIIRKLKHLTLKEAYTFVSQTWASWRWRQQHQRGGQSNGSKATLRGGHLTLVHRIGTKSLYLYIDRECLDSVDKRTVVLHSPYPNYRTVTGCKAGHLVITHQPLGDIDELCLSLRITSNHLKLIDYGIGHRLLQRCTYLVARLGILRLHKFTKQQVLLAILLQIDRRAVHLLATQQLKALWHTGKTRHCQHHASHHRVGHLHIPIVLDMTNGKHTLAHASTLLHHFMVRVFVVCYCCVLTALYLWLRLFLGWDGVVICSDSRLLPHSEQRDGHQCFNDFIVILCIHTCKGTTNNNNKRIKTVYLCFFHLSSLLLIISQQLSFR